MNKSKKPKCGKVTAISISRLYNLGNYQNVKFDLTAQVAPGEDAAETFRNLFWILQKMAPLRSPHCKDDFEKATKKTEQELSEYEKAHLPQWRDEMAAYALKVQQRTQALQGLSDLGGVSKHTDHKQNWDDDDDAAPF